MVYYNGAVVMDMPEAKILNASFLEPGLARYCVDLARDLGVYFHIFLPGTPDSPAETLLAERYGEESEVYRNRTGLKPRIVDLKAALDSPGVRCIKGMFIAEPAVLAAVQERLEQQFGGRFYGARSYVSFLEILAPGVSKGHGLRRALEYRGLPPSQTIAFGDEENDLPLFEAAGFSAAPANAQEQILRAADIHIGPNSEDGVAAFLESLFDIGPP
jgi:hydroxymethylpyrimidine pyrophosphatase-like HAD family hydrolase